MLGLPNEVVGLFERFTLVLVIIFVGIETLRTLRLVEAKIALRAKKKSGGEERQIRAANIPEMEDDIDCAAMPAGTKRFAAVLAHLSIPDILSEDLFFTSKKKQVHDKPYQIASQHRD
jgi:hypothetical protein